MSSRSRAENELDFLLKECRAAGILPAGKSAVAPLQGDASDRRFFRIRTGAAHFIGLLSPRKVMAGRDENDSYFLIGRQLARRRLPVPRILWADLEKGQFLLEDLGDYHLQKHALRGSVDQERLYRSVVSLLVRLHRSAAEGFAADFCFDTAFYSPPFVCERELEYFRKSFLNGYLNLDVDKEDLRTDFERLAEAAGTDRSSHVMHRDFQSRNIMVCRGSLWIIDFQGMRFGPPAYDLASLLLDPYVALSRRLQASLVEYYWSGARRFLGCSSRQFQSSYRATRLCRNLQVLGAYGFLGVSKGKRQFLQYIPRAWEQLTEMMAGPLKGRYPKIEKQLALARRRHRTGWTSRS